MGPIQVVEDLMLNFQMASETFKNTGTEKN